MLIPLHSLRLFAQRHFRTLCNTICNNAHLHRSLFYLHRCPPTHCHTHLSLYNTRWGGMVIIESTSCSVSWPTRMGLSRLACHGLQKQSLLLPLEAEEEEEEESI